MEGHGDESVRLYHGSYDELTLGTVLTARRDGYVGSADGQLEALFESHRPEGCIPRGEAVFLVTDPDLIDAAGGYTDFVYEVEASDMQAHDLAWYTQAQCLLADGFTDRASECARNYWAGLPFHDPNDSLTEYLARSALVVAECEEDHNPAMAP